MQTRGEGWENFKEAVCMPETEGRGFIQPIRSSPNLSDFGRTSNLSKSLKINWKKLYLLLIEIDNAHITWFNFHPVFTEEIG